MLDILKTWPKGEPVPAISIRQPWASLAAWSIKDVENRSGWRYKHRGPLIIQASKTGPFREDCEEAVTIRKQDKLEKDILDAMRPEHYLHEVFRQGAIVGVAMLVEVFGPDDDIPEDHFARASPWASEEANYWLYLEDAVPLTPVPFSSRVGLFKVPYAIARGLKPLG